MTLSGLPVFGLKQVGVHVIRCSDVLRLSPYGPRSMNYGAMIMACCCDNLWLRCSRQTPKDLGKQKILCLVRAATPFFVFGMWL